MRKQLNGRLLFALFVIAVISGTGIYFLHNVQTERSAETLRVLADRAREEGELDKAEDYLARFLYYQPNNVEALVEYAELLEKKDATPEGRNRVIQIYEKAVQIASEERPDLRKRLVDAAMELGQLFIVKPHAEFLRQQQPENGEIVYILGRCEEESGRFQVAASLYDEARKKDPKRIDAYSRLANLLRTRLSDPEGADLVMNATSKPKAEQNSQGLIARNSQSAAAYLARAAYGRRYRLSDVDPNADIMRALELAPEDLDSLLAAAELALARNDFSKAKTYLERGMALYPENADMYIKMANLELRAGRNQEAIQRLKTGLEATANIDASKRAELSWTLANAYLRSGQLVPDELHKDLEQQHLRPVLMDYLDARILIVRKEWAEAVKALETLQPALTTDQELSDLSKQTLILLGECFEQLNNIDKRYDAYRRAVAIDLDVDPFWSVARFGLAAVLVEMNRIDDAIEQYRIIMPRDATAGFALARLQIVQNLRRPAKERRWSEVERTLETVERELKASREAAPASMAEVAMLRAETLAAQERKSEARSLLERASKDFPDQIGLRVALANLVGREGKSEEILKILTDAKDRLGAKLDLMTALADYWSRGGDNAPEELMKLEKDAQSLPPDDQAQFWRKLADAYARIGRTEQANVLLERLAKGQPNDLGVRLDLFDQAIRSGDEAAARRALDDIRQIEGEDGSLWRYGQASLLIQQVRRNPKDLKPLDEARGLLQQVAAQRPSWPRAPLALAELEDLGGNSEAAIQHGLTAILELGARDGAAIGLTLRLLIEGQRLEEASQIVRKLRDEQIPLSSDLGRLVAQISFRAGDPVYALGLAQKAVNDQVKDARELIWLAQIQWAAGENAEPTFRKAVAVEGDSPATRLALILYLVGTNRKDDAKAALKEAEKALPAGGATTLALAQGHDAVGQTEQADVFYRKALEDRPDDLLTLRTMASSFLRRGRLNEAETHLNQIIKVGGDTPEAAWARRMVPLILAVRGDRQESIKALETLGLAKPDELQDAPPADLRARAKTLALQPNRAYRRQAIEALEQLVARRAATPEDLILMAQLLEADGEWPKARERIVEALKERGSNPNYVAFYILALLRNNLLDEAKRYLVQLKQLAPRQVGTIEIEARVLVAEDNPVAAVKLLEGIAASSEDRIGGVARLLEELGQHDAAERMYRQFVKRFQPKNPEAILALASFLGRRGRTKEALDLLDDRAWRIIPTAKIANACVFILYGDRSADLSIQSERVSSRLQKEISAHPELISLQFDLANIRILQGRYDDAETIFRSIHQHNKTIAAPLNNLAWMLAVKGGDKVSEALPLIQEAISLDGETSDLLDTRALAYLATDQVDAAIRDLEDSIAVGPSSEKYFHLSLAHQAKGAIDEANNALRKAHQLGLTKESLHPLERSAYLRLVNEQTKRS